MQIAVYSSYTISAISVAVQVTYKCFHALALSAAAPLSKGVIRSSEVSTAVPNATDSQIVAHLSTYRSIATTTSITASAAAACS